VREKLVDPAFAPWFLRFGATPPINGTAYHSPPCDDNYDPPLCSALYHDSVCAPDEAAACQVPGFPTGDGVCAAPACDVGAVPIGEYLWDPRAWNVSVNGQTLGRWWIDDYLFGEWGGGNENITGFYFDDGFGEGGCSEMENHQLADLGLSGAELQNIAAAYASNMAEVNAAVVARGAFTEQLFFRPQLVEHNDTCAQTLRPLCSADSPAQSRYSLFGFK
jgi:hypothetical protein